MLNRVKQLTANFVRSKVDSILASIKSTAQDVIAYFAPTPDFAVAKLA